MNRPFGLMMLAGLILGVMVASTTHSVAQTEDQFRDRFCSGWKTEVHLNPVRGFADCISDTHAIEVDWASNFKNAIGQALSYGSAAQLTPGLILICDGDQGNCLAHRLAAEQVLSTFSIRSTIWACYPIDETLTDCLRIIIE